MGGIDLQRKLGPLPLWAWGGTAVLLVLAFTQWRSRSAGMAAPAAGAAEQSTSLEYGGTDTGRSDLITAPVPPAGPVPAVSAGPATGGSVSAVTPVASGAVSSRPAWAGVFGRILHPGSQGADVRNLQQALAKAGFNPGPVDSVFGAKTAAALRAYQQSRGLDVTGTASADTFAALTSNKAAATARPAPAATNTAPRGAGQTPRVQAGISV